MTVARKITVLPRCFVEILRPGLAAGTQNDNVFEGMVGVTEAIVGGAVGPLKRYPYTVWKNDQD